MAVGFAFPGAALGEKVNADFIAQLTRLNGLSGHARARREGLEKLFPDPAPTPKLAAEDDAAPLAPRHELPSLRLQRRIDLRFQFAERLCKFRRGEVVAFV